MSFERAYVMCKKCYTNENGTAEDRVLFSFDPRKEMTSLHQLVDEHFGALYQNYAMEALEEARRDAREEDRERADGLLKICRQCDKSEAGIVDSLGEGFFEA